MESGGQREEPTFSVVIPTYQSADTIGDAVRSVLGQTHPAHEIIVVDDGSTDDLDGALEPLREQITLIRKANGGGASALNAGARQATGDFLAILDSDDVYLPGRLSALARLATAQPRLDLLTTDAYFVVDHKRVGRFNVANPFPVDGQRETILERCFIVSPAIRRSRLLEIQGFDEDLSIAYDWDCWLRLILTGSTAAIVDEPHMEYRIHEASLSGNRALNFRARVVVLNKAARNPALRPGELPAVERSLAMNLRRVLLAEAETVSVRATPALMREAWQRDAQLSFPTRLRVTFACLLPRRLRHALCAQKERLALE
jgi:glycosyltransferase involved in cell wall biosynthesis